MTPQDRLTSALAEITSGTVTTGLDFLLRSLLGPSGKVEDCYSPDLYRAIAACPPDEADNIERQLRTKFGTELNLIHFRRGVKVAAARIRMSAVATEDHEDWKSLLLVSERTQAALPCYENAALHFEHSREWKGVLGYNEFTGGHEILAKPPSPVSAKVGQEIEDHFDTEATRWLERKGIMVRPDIVRRIVDSVSRGNRFHPIRRYLESLAWDGKPRISDWLIRYCGVADSDSNPNENARRWGRRWLISAVARVFNPGCKADHMLVLEGKTGIGKSGVGNILAGEGDWFTDQLSDLGGQNASMQVRGVWIVEMAELGVWTKAEENTAKQFVSQTFDRFRIPYGHRIEKFQRQCVFIGTTEKAEWSLSETMRRQWPVRCNPVKDGLIDIHALREDRDQIWAEVVVAFRAGEIFHLSTADEVAAAEVDQRQRFAVDVWTVPVLRAVDNLIAISGEESVSIQEVLSKMDKPIKDQNHQDARRVGSILRMNGLEEFSSRFGLPAGSRPGKRFRRIEESS